MTLPLPTLRRCRRTPLYALHRRARRPDGAVRRLRDAGAVPAGHPRRASAHPRPGRALRRLAYGPGRGSRGADAAAALEALVPGDLAGAGAGADALHAALNEAGGILDDLMVTRRRRRAVPRRQRRVQGRRPRASARAARPRGRRSSRCSTARCWRCRGRRPPRCWRGLPPASTRHAVHERGRGRRSPARRASSPAPAIPARTGSRSRCRPPTPRRWPSAAGRARGGADRARRARHAAARSRALPLRPRHRRDHDPGRGRPRLDHRQAAPRGGRLSRRRDRSCASSPRAAAPARRHPPRRPRPGARGHRDRRPRRQPDRPGHQRRLRPLGRRPDRDGLCRRRRMPPPAPRCRSSCAARRGRPASRRCPSSRTAITAADAIARRNADEHAPLHQGPRMGPRRRRRRRRSASPTTRRRSWATWSLSSCRRSAAGSSRARRRRWSNRSRRRARSMPRSRARWSRSTPRSPATRPRSTPTPMGEGWFFKLSLADPKELDALMDEAAYDALRRGAALMRYLPLTDADRARHAGGDRRRLDRRAVRRRAGGGAARRPASTCRAAMGELEVERALGAHGGAEPRRRLGAVLHRRRRLSPPRAGRGRPPDPARRVPDLLHALPAGDRAGHAADTCSSSRPRSRC